MRRIVVGTVVLILGLSLVALLALVFVGVPIGAALLTVVLTFATWGFGETDALATPAVRIVLMAYLAATTIVIIVSGVLIVRRIVGSVADFARKLTGEDRQSSSKSHLSS